MARTLPPLAALRVFEAAARHQNFTRAAEELGMTQASVSYQIKVLEERVGAPLFVRRARDVLLSEAGRALAPATSEAFDLLASAFTAARGATEGVLTLSVLPTFAANWLAARIGTFQVEHPALAVRIASTADLADFARDEVDAAIRTGRGRWPGLEAHFLMGIGFTPMATPAFLARNGTIESPEQLLATPLVGADDSWWDIWFAASGHPRVEGLSSPGAKSLGAQHLEGRAVLAGQGVGILTPAFFADELAGGRLVQLFDLVCDDDGDACWLCYPAARRTVPKIRFFRDWLLAAVEADAGPPARRG